MTKTLYERLGKKEGITKLVDDVVENHTKNPIVSPGFLAYLDQPERLAMIKKHTDDFFCAGSGGPESYGGRDMPTTHKGMNVSEQEYMAVVDDILEAMDKNSYGDEEKKDVLAILYSLKEGIIRV
jgi:hemoglobin